MTTYGIWMIGVALGLVLLSFLTGGIASPSSWLVDWTNWAVTFFGLSIGGRGFWIASDATVRWLKSK